MRNIGAGVYDESIESIASVRHVVVKLGAAMGECGRKGEGEESRAHADDSRSRHSSKPVRTGLETIMQAYSSEMNRGNPYVQVKML